MTTTTAINEAIRAFTSDHFDSQDWAIARRTLELMGDESRAFGLDDVIASIPDIDDRKRAEFVVNLCIRDARALERLVQQGYLEPDILQQHLEGEIAALETCIAGRGHA